MKKLLSIVTLCLALSLTACGDDANHPITEADIETWTEEDFEEALNALESVETDSKKEQEKTPSTETDSYEAKQEIIDAKWDSGLIQINDKILQYPFHLSDWIELGFDYNLGELSKEYLWAPDSQFMVNLLVNGEKFCSLSFINTMEGYETVETIDPLIESGYIFNNPEKFTIFFPGGLTFGDSLQDVEEVFGKPNNGLSYEYGQINSLILGELVYGYAINISQNDQTVNNLQIGKNINACNMEDLTTITYENVPNIQVSDIHNVSLSWFPESMDTTNSLILVDQRGAKSVVNYNDQTYFVDFYFGLTSQKYAGSYDYIEYGEPLFDETDENGMRRRLYNTGDNYLAVCSTDAYILEACLNLVNATDSSEDILAVLQDFAIEFTKSIQY